VIGRFIIECDPEHLDVAKRAIVFLQVHTEQNEVLSTSHGMDKDVQMFAKRMKRSISVRQVRP
jgi:hypothetical protein